MARRAAAALIGVVFGVTLCWSGMSDPDVIRDALLFRDAYLYGMFASALLVAAVGLQLLRRRAGQPAWPRERPARRHVVGSLIFGVGWGIADACPGPIATQVGAGIPWGLFTLAGTAVGIYLFLRRSRETEPATDVAPAADAVAAPA
jgi:uncharacterized membrane protein YedE/YeeE